VDGFDTRLIPKSFSCGFTLSCIPSRCIQQPRISTLYIRIFTLTFDSICTVDVHARSIEYISTSSITAYVYVFLLFKFEYLLFYSTVYAHVHVHRRCKEYWIYIYSVQCSICTCISTLYIRISALTFDSICTVDVHTMSIEYISTPYITAYAHVYIYSLNSNFYSCIRQYMHSRCTCKEYWVYIYVWHYSICICISTFQPRISTL